MNAEQALFDTYHKWCRLARAAHAAIGREDWPFISEYHHVVKKIQAPLASLHQQVRHEWTASNADSAAKKHQLRSLAFELRGLLESNRKLLGAVRARILARREELGRARRNLKLLRDSYILPRASARTPF